MVFPIHILAASFCFGMPVLLPAQFEAKVQVDEPIEGLCDKKNVYAMFAMFDGQVEMKCDLDQAAIEEKLNAELPFLAANPKFKSKKHVMLNVWVNCKGELVWCAMDGNGESGSAELDEQIVAVFKSLTGWKPATMNGRPVDSMKIWGMEVKNGKLTPV